jgi:UDP-glucose 4-epimerase
VLGAGRWRGTVQTVWRNVVPTFVYRALKHQPLLVENAGVATRDLIFVDDVVRGLISCALRGETGGVYNLATGVETSILGLAKLVNELAGNPEPIAMTPARDWDRSGRRHGSTDKSACELGFTAQVSLRDGLRRTLAWTADNMAWIDTCIARHADAMARLADASSPATGAAR